MSKLLSKWTVVVLVVTAQLAASVGCTSSPAAPPTAAAKTVTINYSMDLTGPSASPGKESFNIVMDYWRSVNDGGGIAGVMVNPLWSDTAAQLEKITASYRRAKEQGSVFEVAYSTVETDSLKDTFIADKMPAAQLILSAGSIEPKIGNSFTSGPLSEESGAGLLDYIKASWKGSERPKVAFATMDAASTKFQRTIFPLYAEKRGIDMKVVIMPIGVMDATSQATQLKQFAPDYTFVFSFPGDGAILVRDGNKVGLKTQYIIFADNVTVPVAGAQAEGLWFYWGLYAYPDSSMPGMKPIVDFLAKYHPGYQLPIGGTPVMTHLSSLMIKAAIENAIKSVGADKVDSAAVLQGMKNIKNLDTGGLSAGNLTFGENERVGSRGLKVFQYSGGKYVPLYDGFRPAPTFQQMKDLTGWKAE